MEQQFYIGENGQRTGPFSLDELFAQNIEKDTLIWTEGIGNWTKAENIDLVKDIFKSTYVKTKKVVDITSNSARSGSKLISDGGVEITAQGVLWSISSPPLINEDDVDYAEDSGDLPSFIEGLASNTSYYLRAFVIDINRKITYGNEVSFITKIATPPALPLQQLKTEKFEIFENDFPNLMNWEEANKACSGLGSGWRLPTFDELYVMYNLHSKKLAFFEGPTYWSSDEEDEEVAFAVGFDYISLPEYEDKESLFHVRAVRDI